MTRRLEMRYIICTALACLLYLGSALPAEKPSPQLSKEPLTNEQVAIYREVLQNYVKDLKDMQLNLANKTVPLDQSYNGCLKGFSFPETDKNIVPIIHALNLSVVPNMRVVLVDPDKQEKIFEAIPRLVQGKEKYSKVEFDRRLKDLEEQEAQAGFLTLSEILFDKERHYAFVAYSFYCGGLCGGGTTIVFEKYEGKWEVSKSTKCMKWIS
jgi:hypothetical protein